MGSIGYFTKMADVKIRKLEDWVVETHRALAEAEGISLEEELRRVVTEAALKPQHDFAQKVRALQEDFQAKYGIMPDFTLHPRGAGSPRMIVIDASVAVKWFSSETGRLAALALLEGRDKLIAPALIRVEVAGALVKKVRTGQVALAAIEAALATWYEAAVTGPLVTVPDDHDLPDASRLALELGHPIYDCLYLALANRYGIPLVTADAAFADRVAARFPNVRMLA